MIAHHTPGFVAFELPNGQYAGLFVMIEHGFHHVVHTRLLRKCKQRMQRAVGVPQRENGVLVVSSSFPGIAVDAFKIAVGIGEQSRSNHGVVKRGIENGFLIFVV